MLSLALVPAILVTAWPALGLAANGRAPASNPPTSQGRVAGEVLSWATKRPVPRAIVTIPALGLRTTSDRWGRFAFAQRIRVPGSYLRVTARVTAPGFGSWTIRGAPVWRGDSLLLHADLRPTAFDHTVLTPAERRSSVLPTGVPSSPTASSPAASGPTCTGWDDQLVPPRTTWIYYSPDAKAEQFDFVFYAVHALQQEWIPSWDSDALGAGAVAVKTYAWWRAGTGHARTGGPGCYDSNDYSDQAFDPTWTSGYAEQAVYATLGSIAWQNGAIFLSHYFAGATTMPCAPVTGTYAGWMSQWGTKNCADAGMLWPAIVETFYSGITWHYLRNLVVNPGAESPARYRWAVLDGDLHRAGTSFAGAYSWKLVPAPSRRAKLLQLVPFDGTANAAYHEKVALQCPTANASACDVTLILTAVTTGGPSPSRSVVIHLPRDGVWRVSKFNPSSFGIDHQAVRLTFKSAQQFGVDSVYITSAFEGP